MKRFGYLLWKYYSHENERSYPFYGQDTVAFCHNTALLITMYFYWLFLHKCNFSQAQCKLPKDGPDGPKHVGANIRYFNVNFNILYA